MPRIRSLKPEFPHDRDLGRLPIPTRYHYLLLKCVADDYGYFRAEPRSLLGALYPYDRNLTESDVDRHGALLREAGLVEFRQTEEGLVGRIVHWAEDERVDHPSRSHLEPIFAGAMLAPPPAPEDGVLIFPGPETATGPAAPPPALPPVSDYALACVRAINAVLDERLAGGNRPLVASIEAPIADHWCELGVPLEFARETCIGVAKRFPITRQSRQPGHLSYFDKAVLEAFERTRTPAPGIMDEAAGLKRLLDKAKRDGNDALVADIERRLVALEPQAVAG